MRSYRYQMGALPSQYRRLPPSRGRASRLFHRSITNCFQANLPHDVDGVYQLLDPLLSLATVLPSMPSLALMGDDFFTYQ